MGRAVLDLLQAALAHMHYLPEETGPAGRTSSYRQMARLLQYRAVRVTPEAALRGLLAARRGGCVLFPFASFLYPST